MSYARGHDDAVLNAFGRLLGLPPNVGHPLPSWTRQLRLPFRFGGLGLRLAQRTSPAAYWASWGDCLCPLSQRFPELGRTLLDFLEGSRQPDDLYTL